MLQIGQPAVVVAFNACLNELLQIRQAVGVCFVRVSDLREEVERAGGQAYTYTTNEARGALRPSVRPSLRRLLKSLTFFLLYRMCNKNGKAIEQGRDIKGGREEKKPSEGI